MANEIEIKEKYMELQMMNQQMKQMQKQIEMIEAQKMELLALNQSLEDLKNVKEGTETLTPVGSGIFVKANIQNPKDLIVNVGANVAVKKEISEAKKLVEKQVKEVNKVHHQAMNEMQSQAVKASSLEKQINKLVKP